MVLVLALGSFSFWQDQLPRFSEGVILCCRATLTSSTGLTLYPVFSEANRLLSIKSCQSFSHYGHLGTVISGHKVI